MLFQALSIKYSIVLLMRQVCSTAVMIPTNASNTLHATKILRINFQKLKTMHKYACICFKRHAFTGNAPNNHSKRIGFNKNYNIFQLQSHNFIQPLSNKDKLTGKRVLKPLPGLSRHENTLLRENLAQKFLFLKKNPTECRICGHI